MKVKYADSQTITRSHTIQGPVRDEQELLDIAAALLQGTFPTRKGIRLLGITLSSLLMGSDEDKPQLSFPL